MSSITTKYPVGNHGRSAVQDHQYYRSASASASHVHVVVGLSSAAHRLPCIRAKHGFSFGTSFNLIRLLQSKRKTNMEVKALENLPPGTPLPSPPSGPPSGSGWFNWLIWTLLPMILPFFKSKWGPLLTIKKQLDTAIGAVECAAEVVEEVAEKIEKIADEVGESLPEGSKLKAALCEVEHVAEEAIKGADLAENFIKKAEEAEKKLETFIEMEKMEKTAENTTEKMEKTAVDEAKIIGSTIKDETMKLEKMSYGAFGSLELLIGSLVEHLIFFKF